ncbi:MAG: ATP-binding protein [Candidatus Nitrosocosmicus sp.]
MGTTAVAINNDFILQLIKIKKNLNLLGNNHLNYLKSYLANDKFFSNTTILHRNKFDKLEDKASEFKQLSLCFALMSLLKSKFTLNKIERQLNRKGIFQEFVNNILDEKHNCLNDISRDNIDNSFNNFVIPFILLFLKSVKEEKEFNKISIDNRFIIQSVKSIVKYIQEYDYYFIHQGKKNPSPFITYYSAESLYTWYDEIEKFVKDEGGDSSSKTESEKLLDDINKIFEDVFLWARDVLFQQIAYYSANDLDRKDPYLALYSMLIYKKYNSIYKNKLYFLKSEYNKYVVKKLVGYLLSEDKGVENIWERKELAANIGYVSIYTFGLATLTELFSIMDSDEYENYFINSINKILDWLINNEKKGDTINVTIYNNDSISESKISNNYYGWPPVFIKNEFDIDESISYCYSTSLIFSNILSLKESLTRILIPKIILNEFEGDYRTLPNYNTFNRLLDMVIDQGYGLMSVKKLLYRSIIEPRLNNNNRGLENLPNSICFYGPPGTGKTTLASSIAEVLGWSFIRIEPSAFVKDGMDRFAQRVSYVFDCLKHLEKTVILFDEMDEYIKKRAIDTDKDSKVSYPDFFNRLSTNIFLTEIDKLYKSNKNVIYIIATNNINDIDEAITRADRIDFKLFIDYIYPKELIGMLEEKIEDVIKTENNSNLAVFCRSDNYTKLKQSIENELLSRVLNYKQCEIFVNLFVQSLENTEHKDMNNFNQSEIVNEIKQSFGEIDYRYLETRKEQSMINRIDNVSIKDCEYVGYRTSVVRPFN